VSVGETNLDVLIQSMEPVLHDETYVFLTVENGFDTSTLTPLMRFQESEGTTLILEQRHALAAGLAHVFACKMITLNIHSSLDAVGFLARVTARLAGLQMGVNPVSGFYHDHLFIPIDRAQDAMAELQLMSAEITEGT